MTHAVTHALFAYWNALRDGRAAPDRDDIDPAAIRSILPHTFLLESTRERPSRARDLVFRLSGTRLDALFGCDLRGLGFDRIWSASSELSPDDLVDAVFASRGAVVAESSGGPAGYDGIDCELSLLPLCQRVGSRALLLGSLASAVAPGWMGLFPATPLDLLSFREVQRPNASGTRWPAGVAVAPAAGLSGSAPFRTPSVVPMGKPVVRPLRRLP